MYPVLVALTIGFVIAVERYIKLTTVLRVNRNIWQKSFPLLTQGKFKKVQNIISGDNTEIATVLRTALKRQGEIQQREDIELLTEISMTEIVPQLEKRTAYVALLANISTLLGLLGTIVGLIDAFTAVASAAPAEKSDFLSASISVAMNTTAFGLISAIILLIMHAIIRSKTVKIISSLEIISVKTLNIITEFSQHKTFDKNNKLAR